MRTNDFVADEQSPTGLDTFAASSPKWSEEVVGRLFRQDLAIVPYADAQILIANERYEGHRALRRAMLESFSQQIESQPFKHDRVAGHRVPDANVGDDRTTGMRGMCIAHHGPQAILEIAYVSDDDGGASRSSITDVVDNVVNHGRQGIPLAVGVARTPIAHRDGFFPLAQFVCLERNEQLPKIADHAAIECRSLFSILGERGPDLPSKQAGDTIEHQAYACVRYDDGAGMYGA